jgi:hypothetical protein
MSFLKGILEFLEDFVKFLREVKNGMVEGLTRFLEFMIEKIEAAYNFIVRMIKSIIDYLTRFFTAVFKLFIVLIQLSLFYIPSLVFAIIWICTGSGFWLFLGIVWAIAITAIGLFYRRK